MTQGPRCCCLGGLNNDAMGGAWRRLVRQGDTVGLNAVDGMSGAILLCCVAGSMVSGRRMRVPSQQAKRFRIHIPHV